VQALQSLLLDAFDLHRRDVGTACRFQLGCRIGGIGLVAFDVGADAGGRQQSDFNAQTRQPARPVMGGAAGFLDYAADGTVVKPGGALARLSRAVCTTRQSASAIAS
jgi:hypothetical protein